MPCMHIDQQVTCELRHALHTYWSGGHIWTAACPACIWIRMSHINCGMSCIHIDQEVTYELRHVLHACGSGCHIWTAACPAYILIKRSHMNCGLLSFAWGAVSIPGQNQELRLSGSSGSVGADLVQLQACTRAWPWCNGLQKHGMTRHRVNWDAISSANDRSTVWHEHEWQRTAVVSGDSSVVIFDRSDRSHTCYTIFHQIRRIVLVTGV